MSFDAGGPPVHRRGLRAAPWLTLQVVLSASLVLLFVLPIYALFAYAPFQIARYATDPAVDAALWLTFLASMITVLVAVVFAIPLGYVLARRRFPGRSVLEAVVALPVVVPHLLVGLGLFLLLLPGSPAYRLTTWLGLPIYDTIWGVVLVMAFVSTPYTVLASDLSFRAIDDRMLEASRSLGAGPATAFLTISFPLAFRGILAGLLLTWARAVSEIGGILILAYEVLPGGPYSGPPTSTISVLVWSLFQAGNLQGAAAVSAVFLLIAFVVFVAVRLAERSGWVPWRRGDLLP
jgi:molybdate/tungstate transport system permease protein